MSRVSCPWVWEKTSRAPASPPWGMRPTSGGSAGTNEKLPSTAAPWATQVWTARLHSWIFLNSKYKTVHSWANPWMQSNLRFRGIVSTKDWLINYNLDFWLLGGSAPLTPVSEIYLHCSRVHCICMQMCIHWMHQMFTEVYSDPLIFPDISDISQFTSQFLQPTPSWSPRLHLAFPTSVNFLSFKIHFSQVPFSPLIFYSKL